MASQKISEFPPKLTPAVDADQVALLDSESGGANARQARALFLAGVARTADLGTAASLDGQVAHAHVADRPHP